MRNSVLLYGIVGGLLTALLKTVEYRYLILDHSVGIYVALVAALFAGVGIWLGQKLTRTRETVIVREVPVHIEVPVRVEVPMPVPANFVRDERKLESLGITKRELEILGLMAAGLSTREMAERVCVSENTVKTQSRRTATTWAVGR